MKNISSLLLLAILTSATFLTSCSYTNKSTSSSHFSKKHYNRGVVKNKKTKTDKETVALLQTVEGELKTNSITEEIEQQIVGNQYTTSSNEMSSEEPKESFVVKTIKENFANKKALIEAVDRTTVSEKDNKRLDKALRRMNKVEKMLLKYAPKIAAKANVPDKDGIMATNNDKKSLAALILGALSIVFAAALVGIGAGIAAIILGYQSPGGGQSGNQGRIGMILGWVGIALSILALIVGIAFIF